MMDEKIFEETEQRAKIDAYKAKAYADEICPEGCQCTTCNGGGDCAWCQARASYAG